MNKQQKTQSVGEDTKHILSDALWTFRRVGHGVGQANLLPENPNKLKRKPVKIARFSPVFSFIYSVFQVANFPDPHRDPHGEMSKEQRRG